MRALILHEIKGIKSLHIKLRLEATKGGHMLST